jgi:hypothetical protein
MIMIDAESGSHCYKSLVSREASMMLTYLHALTSKCGIDGLSQGRVGLLCMQMQIGNKF